MLGQINVRTQYRHKTKSLDLVVLAGNGYYNPWLKLAAATLSGFGRHLKSGTQISVIGARANLYLQTSCARSRHSMPNYESNDSDIHEELIGNCCGESESLSPISTSISPQGYPPRSPRHLKDETILSCSISLLVTYSLDSNLE